MSTSGRGDGKGSAVSPAELAALLRRAGSNSADEERILKLCEAAGVEAGEDGKIELLVFFAALQILNQ